MSAGYRGFGLNPIELFLALEIAPRTSTSISEVASRIRVRIQVRL